MTVACVPLALVRPPASSPRCSEGRSAGGCRNSSLPSRTCIIAARPPAACSLPPLCKGYSRRVQPLSGQVHRTSVRTGASYDWQVGQGQPSPGTYLRKLHIQDFALVSQQTVDFTPGLNVLTGESGAGKSVVILALGQVFGGMASANLVRSRASKAVVTGWFHLDEAGAMMVGSLLHEAGLPAMAMPSKYGCQADLEVRREVWQNDGVVKSRCYINGKATSLRVLRLLGSVLVDVNGQGASNSLQDPDIQLEQLDRIAGTELQAQMFGAQLERYQQLQAQMDQLALLEDEEAREDLQRMADEVIGMGITVGEEKQLRSQMRRMQEQMVCVQRCSMIKQAISGDGGVGIASVFSDIEYGLRENHRQEMYIDAAPDHCGNSPPENLGLGLLESAMEDLMHASDSLRAVELAVDAYVQSFEFNEQDFDQVAARLSEISAAMKRYRCPDTSSLVTLANKSYQQLEEWWELEAQWEDIVDEHEALGEFLGNAAGELSIARRGAATALCGAVRSCLAELGMPESQFEVELSWSSSGSRKASAGSLLRVPEEMCEAAGLEAGVEYFATSSGLDTALYLLAAGSEETLRPLGSVASGGETARIMLSLKAAPSYIATTIDCEEEAMPQTCPIMVMDELDTGVGGRLGSKVGQMMSRMCQTGTGYSPTAHQILCVTHLPQVAAHAVHHLRVSKGVDLSEDVGQRTVTVVEALEGYHSRVEELTEMMGVAADGTELARQMLEAAQSSDEATSQYQAATFDDRLGTNLI